MDTALVGERVNGWLVVPVVGLAAWLLGRRQARKREQKKIDEAFREARRRRRAARNTERRLHSEEEFHHVTVYGSENQDDIAWWAFHESKVIPTAEKLIEDERNPRSG